MRLGTGILDRIAPVEKAAGSLGLGSMYSGPGLPDTVDSAEASTTAQLLTDYLREMNAKDARQWAVSNVWARRAIQQRRDLVSNATPRILAENPAEPIDQELAAEIMTLLTQPNQALQDNSFGGFWGPVIEDALVIESGTGQVLLNGDRTPRGFKILDSARITTNKKWQADPQTGALPPISLPRYFYAKLPGQSGQPIPLANDEVIILRPTGVSYQENGLSPVQVLKRVMLAELDSFTSMHQGVKYHTPPGVFITPGAPKGTAARMRLMYELKLMGRAAIGFMSLPKDSKFVGFGDIDVAKAGTLAFYEIQIMATAAAFATSPFLLGWVKLDDRSNSEVQMQINDDGAMFLLRFLRQVIQQRVIASYGIRAANMRFTFAELERDPDPEDAVSLRAKAGAIGFISINELRLAGGLTPITEEDVGPLLFPFFSQPWVPSALGGVYMPIVYAAASYGIYDGDVAPIDLVGPGEPLPGQHARVNMPTVNISKKDAIPKAILEMLCDHGVRALRGDLRTDSGLGDGMKQLGEIAEALNATNGYHPAPGDEHLAGEALLGKRR